MQLVIINLGTPRHGWLPFHITIGEFSISDEASDLGLNVIDQLINMLSSIRDNQHSESYFYLEPAAYILKVRPNLDTTLLQVQFLDDFDSDDNQMLKTLHEAEVQTFQLNKTLIDALKAFREFKYDEQDWPIPGKVEILNSLIN